MFKQATKKRLITILVAIILLAAMLGAPIRREYSMRAIPCADGSNANCGTIFTTDVHYGAPFAWLTLSKSVNQESQKIMNASTVKATDKLTFDLLLWCLLVAVAILIKGTANLKQHANPRH